MKTFFKTSLLTGLLFALSGPSWGIEQTARVATCLDKTVPCNKFMENFIAFIQKNKGLKFLDGKCFTPNPNKLMSREANQKLERVGAIEGVVIRRKLENGCREVFSGTLVGSYLIFPTMTLEYTDVELRQLLGNSNFINEFVALDGIGVDSEKFQKSGVMVNKFSLNFSKNKLPKSLRDENYPIYNLGEYFENLKCNLQFTYKYLEKTEPRNYRFVFPANLTRMLLAQETFPWFNETIISQYGLKSYLADFGKGSPKVNLIRLPDINKQFSFTLADKNSPQRKSFGLTPELTLWHREGNVTTSKNESYVELQYSKDFAIAPTTKKITFPGAYLDPINFISKLSYMSAISGGNLYEISCQ